MSTLLQLQSGNKSFGLRSLFVDAQFSVNEDEHIGVIGPNGAGKTTLFRILTGDDSLDSGEIVKAKVLRLGYLAQHDHWGPEDTVTDYLSKDCKMPIWELKALGKDLGVTNEMFERPITSLSGGYRMRCKLLYLIGCEPNLMLLDEPTNYLDLETTLVLERFLQGYKGAFLLISHDREFLRRTTDHIIEIEQGEITKYNGNLDDYFEQKELLRTQLEARAQSLKDKREKVLEFVARFGAKATKAKQAQSRLKSLNRMETIELKSLPVTAAIKIPAPTKTGKIILSLQNANSGYGDKTILKNVDFILKNGDHLAVVGLNGAGKSTFLKVLAEVMPPLTGNLERGYQVSIGYYAQHVAENLNPNDSVIEGMMAKAHPQVLRQEILNMAGSLLFSGDDMHKKISVLSGGEKSRVALGQILLQKAPCLILDEPTNHLDFQTVEALTQALMSYEGTTVVVSHDRSFIRRIGKQILEINNGAVALYPGTYDEYVWSLQRGALAERKNQANEVAKTASSLTAAENKSAQLNSKESRKNRDRELRQCEKSLKQLEEKLAIHQEKLAALNEKIARGSRETYNEHIKELGEIHSAIEAMEAEWLSASEKHETLKSE